MTKTPSTDGIDLSEFVTNIFNLVGVNLTEDEKSDTEDGPEPDPELAEDEDLVDPLTEAVRVLFELEDLAEGMDDPESADILKFVADRWIQLAGTETETSFSFGL